MPKGASFSPAGFLEEYELLSLYEVDSKVGIDLAAIVDGRLEPADRKILTACLGSTKRILVEHDYIDKDYRNVFSGYYSKKFALSSNRATRLHFFNVPLEFERFLSTDNLVGYLGELAKGTEDANSHSKTTPGYVGCIVIRPTEYSRIGRCLLDPRKICDFGESEVY